MKIKSREVLKKQHYALIGEHSGIQICRWTKKSLLDEGNCYKEKFYGIKSHRCCQMTPCFLCMNSCLHCWRAVELNIGSKLEKVDDVKFIIDNCILAQRKMLSGFGGNEKINKNKFKEAQDPKQFAISLSGEPTIYPKLAELVLELRNRKITSFIVTNGLLPERILELKKKNALPTQIYVSLNYPNEKIFRIITRNKSKIAWDKLLKTLDLMKNLKTRTVVRINLVRNLNMDDEMISEYAKLIKKTKCDFLEIKGYMSVGYARERLGYERMPIHSEIKDFSSKLLKFLPRYKFLDEKTESRVVLLGKNKKDMKIKGGEI
ncbi:MAG: 4-demethylwyosine synthase TYW1 [Nanoarchaeota archaeon]